MREIGDTYFASGGFSDIWKGQWINHPHPLRSREVVSDLHHFLNTCTCHTYLDYLQVAIKAFKGSRIPAQAEKFKRVRHLTLLVRVHHVKRQLRS